MLKFIHHTVYWIVSIFVSYIIIALINSDFIPSNWSDIWQATWLIVTLQLNHFIRLKNTVNKYDVEEEYKRYIGE